MTYRDRFGTMPKLKHDKNSGQSEVISHIAGAMQCDTERASRVFNELRKRGIIVFDRIDRAWHGSDNRSIRYTDSERIERLEKRLENLETKHRKLLAAYRAHIQLGGSP